MALRAPPVRNSLAADALVGLLRTGLAALAEHRPGTPAMALTDARLAALALFSLPSPSLLAFAQERTAGQGQRVYGRKRVPCETARRAILAPGQPTSLRPLFTELLRARQRGKALAERGCVEGHAL
jgi:hypothetical protein